MSNNTHVRFGGQNKEKLAGILELPDDGTPRAHAIFAHCFTCSKDLHASRRISRALASEGIATLRIDFTGLGESEGEFVESTFTSNIEDVTEAAEFLAAEHGPARLLVGHSLGGAAVVKASARLADVRAVATIGSPSEPSHVTHLFTKHKDDIRKHGQAEVSIGGRPFKIGADFLDDLERQSVQDVLAKLRKPFLIMHSPIDNIVSIDHARKLFEAAYHPKSFISLDDADHLLSKPRDARYAARLIAAWGVRYLIDDD